MTATVTQLFPLGRSNPDHAPASCGCCDHGPCYPHRVAAAADALRSLPDVLEGDAWVFRADVRSLAARVLEQLDAITAECLPADERTAR